MSGRLPETEVLVVSPTFHPEPVGTPHYATDLVDGIAGVASPRVITNQPFYPGFQRFPGYGRATRHDWVHGVPVHRLPTIVPRRGQSIWRILSELNMLLQVILGRASRTLDPSHRVVAVSPGSPASLLASRMLRQRAGWLTVIVHDVGFGLADTTSRLPGRSLSALIRRLEVWAMNRADRITVLSDRMGDVLRTAGVTTPIETISLWPTIRRPEGIGPPEPTVLYSGSLGRKQGVHHLLDLAYDLAELDAPVSVVIRGDGPARKALVQDAKQRGLENVTFEPFVPKAALAGSLASARIHVVPQLPEAATFAVPSKIVNILATGRPVVVTAERDSPVGDLAQECPAIRLVEPSNRYDFAKEVHRLAMLPAHEYTELCEAASAWAGTHDRDQAIRRTLAGMDIPHDIQHRSPN